MKEFGIEESWDKDSIFSYDQNNVGTNFSMDCFRQNCALT